MSLSATLQQLDCEWLDGVLREAGHNQSKVTELRVEQVALSGATTDMVRLRTTYADPGGGPESMVAKIRGAKPVQVQMDQAMGLFERERRFYTEIAHHVPVHTAALFHAGDGDTTPLILQDLGAMRMGDQQLGLAVDDAAAMMDSLAALHAHFWQSPELKADWLVSPTEGIYCQMIAQVVASGAGAVTERFAGRVSKVTLAAVTDAAHDWHHACSDALKVHRRSPTTTAGWTTSSSTALPRASPCLPT